MGHLVGASPLGGHQSLVTFRRAREKVDTRLHVFLVVEDPQLIVLRGSGCARQEMMPRISVLDQRTPFSVYIPSSIAGTIPPIGKADMRALVCVASPKSLDRFQLSEFDPSAFAPRHAGDWATPMLVDYLLKPLADRVATDFSDWSVRNHSRVGSDQTPSGKPPRWR
jgi:hypothetical protein